MRRIWPICHVLQSIMSRTRLFIQNKFQRSAQTHTGTVALAGTGRNVLNNTPTCSTAVPPCVASVVSMHLRSQQ